jgi:hypothetical protein
MSSDPEILSISGINKDGKNVIQIINLKKEPAKIEISGIAGKLSNSVTTTEQNNWKENDIPVKISGDKIVTEIRAESQNTLVF